MPQLLLMQRVASIDNGTAVHDAGNPVPIEHQVVLPLRRQQQRIDAACRLIRIFTVLDLRQRPTSVRHGGGVVRPHMESLPRRDGR